MRSFCGKRSDIEERPRIRLPPKEWMKSVMTGILLTAGIAFLFYRSVWGLLLGVILIPIYMKRRRKQWEERQKRCFQRQFISCIQMVAGSLNAGCSMENAWKRAEADLVRLYGPEAEICREMRLMNQRTAMNEPLEQILWDFASQSQTEDISNFAEIFRYARRSGGNLTEIIRNCVKQMQEKAEVLAEIENAVASRKLEQRMMNILLPGVLLFVTVSSPSYVSTLYHNGLGVLVMSICLAGYAGCFLWSEKLTDIAV